MTTCLLFCIASIVHAHNSTDTNPHKHNTQTDVNGGLAVITAFALFFIVAEWSTFVRMVSTCCEGFWGCMCSIPRKCVKYMKTKCCKSVVVDAGIEMVPV